MAFAGFSWFELGVYIYFKSIFWYRRVTMGGFIGLKIVKRDGSQVPVQLDEITKRNAALCAAVISDGVEVARELSETDVSGLTLEVITRNVDDLRTGTLPSEVIDLMTVDALNNLWLESAEHTTLAGRVLMSTLQKTCKGSFSERIAARHLAAPKRITKEFAAVVADNARALDEMIRPERDYMFNLQAARTLIGAYLQNDPHAPKPETHRELHSYLRSRHGALVVETPQHAYMRAAVAVYADRLAEGCADALDDIRGLYTILSLQQGSLASPFIFNAGSARKSPASCMLMSPADNLPSIMETELQTAIAAANGAGIGVGWERPRCKGSVIRSTGGTSTGVPSWIRGHSVKRDTITQGSYRMGASAHYIPYWHPDFETVIQMAELSGYLASQNLNAPRLMYAAVLDGNFFELYEKNQDVVLLDPGHPRVLEMSAARTVDEFNEIFWELQANPPEGARRRPARDIYKQIYVTIRERGYPYVWYWDNATRQSNMASYMGPVKHSNLCGEITIHSVPPQRELPVPIGASEEELGEWERQRYGEIGVCVLASVNVRAFVRKTDAGPKVDFQGIRDAASKLARALDVSLDSISFGEALKGAELSVKRHRAIAVGVCGVAAALQALRFAYASREGLLVDQAMQAAVYLGAAEASCDRGMTRGGFPGATPETLSSQGLTQPQVFYREFKQGDESWMKSIESATTAHGTTAIRAEVWPALSQRFANGECGNVYQTATMPTASTAIIMQTSQGADPRHNNIYTVKQQTSRVATYNQELLDFLKERGLYSKSTLAELVASEGSVLKFAGLTPAEKQIFLAAHEQPPEAVVMHAAATQPFCTQGKSTNFNMPAPDLECMYRLHRLSHVLGCVTGSYYMYSHGAAASVSWLQAAEPEELEAEDEEDDGERAEAALEKLPVARGGGCESGACSL